MTADNDYQVLGPWRVTDPNGNKQEVAFDALHRVVATAVVGRLGEGDTLSDPTSTVTYELDRWGSEGKPARMTVQTRETHADSNSRWQTVVTYSDGGGNAVLTKQRAWPGEAPLRDANGDLVFDGDGDLVLDWVSERWVGSGRVQVDNKGKPVKQYEPFFSATSEYEDEVQLVTWGVSSVLRYDPLGRTVCHGPPSPRRKPCTRRSGRGRVGGGPCRSEPASDEGSADLAGKPDAVFLGCSIRWPGGCTRARPARRTRSRSARSERRGHAVRSFRSR